MPIASPLRRNLARMGYVEPTPIQRAFLEPVLKGHDAIGLAKTGTGKTTAFLLPIGERLLAATGTPRIGSAKGPAAASPPSPATRSSTPDRTPNKTRMMTAEVMAAERAARRLRAVILCPTRELAIQVTGEASRLLRGTGLRGLCVHGKVAITPQVESLQRGVDLLVGTPGRLRELLDAKALDLSFVRTVALDEADRMLDMGFEPQVREILNRIPGDRQALMLSATMPAAVRRLADDLLRHPVRVEVDPSTTPVTHVRQRVIAVDDDLKVPLLLALLAGADGRGAAAERHGVLVFCRTRRRAGWIATALKRHSISVGSLHGDKSHAQRTKALSRFTAGDLRVLVATDVASRGLHVEAVRCVISYDLPTAPEEHVHRIGRAAHGLEGRGGQGEAIVLLSPDDQQRWNEVLPLVGEATTPERAPRLDAFLVNAPARTQRAAGGTAPARTDRATGSAPKRRTTSATRSSTAAERREPAAGAKRSGAKGPKRPTRKGKAKGKPAARSKAPPRRGTGVRSLRKSDE